MTSFKYEYELDKFSSFYRKLPDVPGHQHNDVEISLIEESAVTISVGGRDVVLQPGHMNVFWAMIPHRLIEGRIGVTMSYVVRIPLSWVLQWPLPPSFVAGLLHGRHLSQSQLPDSPESQVRTDIASFQRWHKHINGGDQRRRDVTLLEIQARLINLALDLQDSGALGNASGDRDTMIHQGELSNVTQMVSYIAMHYNEDLVISDIAGAAHLNSVYAMRLFRATCGTTLLNYLMQHRVWHAQRLLSTTGLKMIEIARAVGFGSDSQFYATFKRISGTSPREYRRSVQQRGT